MSVAVSSFLAKTPNPSSAAAPSRTVSPPVSPSLSLRFESLPRYRTCNLSIAARNCSYPLGLGSRLLSLRQRSSPFVAFAASHEDSPDIDVEREKDDLQREAQESEEAWMQTLAAFKEQATKMQSISKEAYELYSKKAMIILKDTSEQLKIQAEKARYDLSVTAKEISEDGKEYLSAAAKNTPEPVKEIVETFSSPTEDLNDVSKVRDFYVGIPYGLLLSVSGFLSFMLTGSIPAIRFGVILGTTLLALSVASLRSFKRGESSRLALKGQTGIAGVLFVREICLMSQRPSFFSFLTTLISGAVVAFYVYRIKQDGQTKRSIREEGAEA